MIYAGNYIQTQKYDIVRFEKGLSIKERQDMIDGLIPEVYEDCISSFGMERCKKSSLYSREDEHGNNLKPYCWVNEPMKYFGQYVTHWMPLPKKPKK